MKVDTLRYWRGSASILPILVLALAAPLSAQEQQKDDKAKADASDEPSEGETEAIIITGTNISGVKPAGSEAITINATQIQAMGVTTPADAIRTIPQVRNLGEYREGGTQGGNNNQQGNAINLRGLGVGATLVLVDGHRVVASGASQTFTEANQVPLAALERIEVIADGASAIYGSDAVAGVINYVTRKDYDGLETSLRMSNATGGFEITPGLTAGQSWNDLGGLGRGNLIVSYEYTSRDPYLRGSNPYLRQDLRQFGGADYRIASTTATAGNPGNIYVANPGSAQNTTLPRAGTNTYYGLPNGANTSVTASQLLLNQPNLIDSSDYTDYTGRLRRHQVAAFFNQQLGDHVEFFAQGSYSNRKTTSLTTNTENLNVTLKYFLRNAANQPTTTVNPLYISGIPNVAPQADINVQYNLVNKIGASRWNGEDESFNITTGFRFDLPLGWKGNAYYTLGRDWACNYCQYGVNVNGTAAQYQIDIGAINPLSNAPLTATQIATFTGDNIQRSHDTAEDAVVKFDGPLFAIPGGTVRAAFGGERNTVSNGNLNGANRGITNAFTVDTDFTKSKGTRTVTSAFAELYVPLVGGDMNVPLIRELNIDAAIRYDHYSDVGNTTNPKIGVTWVVNDFVSLRGSWGTSFRAPAVPDVNPDAISGGFTIPFWANNTGDPRIVNDFDFGPGAKFTTIGYVFGANPSIKPEKATNWSIGAEFKAPFDRNLRFQGTYYSINYRDRIAGPAVFGLLGNIPSLYPNYNGYGSFIVPIHNPSTCSNTDVTSLDPLLQAYLGRTILYAGGLSNPCSIRVLLDGRNTNLAATQQDGLDASINYMIPITKGAITMDASVNKVFHNKEQVTATAPFTDRLGFIGTPVAWRGRGSIGAMWNGLNANLFMTYTGSYTNDQAVDGNGTSIAPQKVGAYATFDLNLGYSTPQDAPRWARGIRTSVNFQNVTNKAPRLVYTNGSVFNSTYSNPYGRTVTFQIAKSF